MTRAQLVASRALWRRRLTFRQRKVDYHRGKAKEPKGGRVVVTGPESAAIHKWEQLRDQAKDMVARRDRQLGGDKPKIITASSLGLTFQYVFGTKGTITRGAWHYTAGHRSADADDLRREMRNDHAFHKGKGWGGLSYEVMIADDGTIGFGNPINRKSAAVASNNTGMVNICCPGTTGDNITAAAERSIKWLKANWHTSAVPSAHRLPKSAGSFGWRGHKEYPGQATACPGDMLDDYKRAW
jgi:hypothetical protein